MITDADIEKAAKAIARRVGDDDLWAGFVDDAKAALEAVGYHSWMPIDDDAKAAPEILAWREDCGPFLARWIAPCDFLPDDELESENVSQDDWDETDWFYADFRHGGRVTDGAPTHYKLIDAPHTC